MAWKALSLTLARRTEEASTLEQRLTELQQHLDPASTAIYMDLKTIAAGAPGADAVRARLVALASGAAAFPGWRELRQIAPWLAQLGETDAALDVLEARAEAGVVDMYDMLWLHPAFAPIRSDPRFLRVSEGWRPSFEELLATLDRAELPDYLARAKSELRVELGLARS